MILRTPYACSSGAGRSIPALWWRCVGESGVRVTGVAHVDRGRVWSSRLGLWFEPPVHDRRGFASARATLAGRRRTPSDVDGVSPPQARARRPEPRHDDPPNRRAHREPIRSTTRAPTCWDRSPCSRAARVTGCARSSTLDRGHSTVRGAAYRRRDHPINPESRTA